MHRRRIGGLLLLVLGLSGAALAAERPTLADAVEQRDRARVRTRPKASIPPDRRADTAPAGAPRPDKDRSQRYDAGLHLAAILHQADAERQ